MQWHEFDVGNQSETTCRINNLKKMCLFESFWNSIDDPSLTFQLPMDRAKVGRRVSNWILTFFSLPQHFTSLVYYWKRYVTRMPIHIHEFSSRKF